MFALVVAFLMWLVGTTILAIGVPALATVEQLESTLGRLVWFALPQFVLMLVMVFLAALALGRDRLRSKLGAVVVLAPPAVALVDAAILEVAGDAPGFVIASKFLCGVLGAVTAWWLSLPAKEAMVFPRP
ncbi:hypothetical protein [Nocardiopsis rhodophaea]|uniref:hypothetical protein n=1 Tax=Nocardiopsis rhodophaea TaxID=280238 RepID=UPI0031D4D9FC